MELREYQKITLSRLSEYLVAAKKHRDKYLQLWQTDKDVANEYDFAKKAWEDLHLLGYHSSKTGLIQPVADVYLKVPTGGGKTLLAVHSIELINRLFLEKQDGLVLWIVPSNQIYKQTLGALRDRNHPYRQVLDVASAGRTLILEKLDNFSAQDAETNLCVLLLMLPSANRKDKETLKIFQDNGGYTSFFPAEDDYTNQSKLLEQVPNLETFSAKDGFFGMMPKTSLGNVLRMQKPIVVVDEGQRAYSGLARETILGFNPSFILELSATPPKISNKLIEITGKQLLDEQMIKLDLNVTNKSAVGWQETVTSAKEWRDQLEKVAKNYQQNTGVYIRPIMLIQVERTGVDQRDGQHIHSEDVKDYLIRQCAVPSEQVAIKSSARDDIERIDLLSPGSTIRYIITKQALQEGWDCPFAYVLCSLGRSHSEMAMTQLIGRVLRQPYAVKTKVKELDESYVFTFQTDTSKLVSGIKKNLEYEGMGDIAGRISVVDDTDANKDFQQTRNVSYRESFRKFSGKILLPVFAIQDGLEWREVQYLGDLLSRLDWGRVDLSDINNLTLEDKAGDDVRVRVGYRDKAKLQAEMADAVSFESDLNLEYISRQIVDIVPNPWQAFEIAKQVAILLQNKYKDKGKLAANLMFILEELRKVLFSNRDRLCEEVFHKMLKNGEIKFYLLKSGTSVLPSKIAVRSTKPLMNEAMGQLLQISLLDYVPSEDMNDWEKQVALFLDSQKQLVWWYRNIAKLGYRIQGWKPNRIYPDFIAAKKNEKVQLTYDKVYVLEAKGEQLMGNPDTEYKRKLLDLCNQLAVEKSWQELLPEEDKDFVFEMVDESTWKNQLQTIFIDNKN